MAALHTYMKEGVLVAQFNRKNPLNPLDRELETEIVDACRLAQDEPAVKAMVLTGGAHRSFCVGDDFYEAVELNTQAAVEQLVDRLVGLYTALLSVTKPTVAGMDGYAIGGGVQIALCCDWRVGTPTTKALGWELKYGLGCPLGAYMLGKSLGRAAMSDIIFGCEPVSIGWALRCKFFNEVADGMEVVERAISRAAALGRYPECTYRRTKECVNRSFIAGLQELTSVAKKIHVEGFLKKAAEAHFARVLRR
ncbi:enoyl-CoA hydratase/isomerase family protein [Bradyrhizobium sp. 145]|uniref:enoyl-CoA hydratase/isomerase family protein n=1 Tax=Bradyrhizobium sp. 145 TaxID=2782621 RepID=UPI001FF75994|nr:enoyl-CoA hydratase/isomerase family protein [Bradyrhizobium sp. 145]MCK1691070.1 enoyl-CoA hydratase/isomerase family protein [Bradyrhizobium sp. 145]